MLPQAFEALFKINKFLQRAHGVREEQRKRLFRRVGNILKHAVKIKARSMFWRMWYSESDAKYLETQMTSIQKEIGIELLEVVAKLNEGIVENRQGVVENRQGVAENKEAIRSLKDAHWRSSQDRLGLLHTRFKEIIKERTKHFSGRQWLFEELKDWLKSEFRGVGEQSRVILGNMGTGKSAIMASIVRHHRLGTRVTAFHICDYRRASLTCDVWLFVLNIMEQLWRNVPGFREAFFAARARGGEGGGPEVRTRDLPRPAS